MKCWQENSGSTGIHLLFLHIYFRYYMISLNEPFGHGRKKTKSMQRLIAKKGPIDRFALMCAGTSSRSSWINRISLFLVPLNPYPAFHSICNELVQKKFLFPWQEDHHHEIWEWLKWRSDHHSDLFPNPWQEKTTSCGYDYDYDWWGK